MNVKRNELLNALNSLSIGLAAKANLSQSDCFVFMGEYIITFNDDIMVRVKSPVDIKAAVPALELMGVLGKMPDDEIKFIHKGPEIVIKGKRRSAGITCESEIALPVESVPAPGKWSRISEETIQHLLQASQTCGMDETQPLTFYVHITPRVIEACDNNRLFRVDGDNGLPGEVLLPGKPIGRISKMGVKRISIGDGWVHFKTEGGAVITLRCSHEEYHRNIEDLFKLESPRKVVLPKGLLAAVGRAEIMSGDDALPQVSISIANNEVVITSRKMTGWYKERSKVDYTDTPISFDVHPEFIRDVLNKTRTVIIGSDRMSIKIDNIRFVVSLQLQKNDADQDE